jgi:hypothetical protein
MHVSTNPNSNEVDFEISKTVITYIELAINHFGTRSVNSFREQILLTIRELLGFQTGGCTQLKISSRTCAINAQGEPDEALVLQYQVRLILEISTVFVGHACKFQNMFSHKTS